MFTSWHGITRLYKAQKPCFINSRVLNVCSIASTTSLFSVSTRLVGLIVQVPFVSPCIAIYRTDIFADAGPMVMCLIK